MVLQATSATALPSVWQPEPFPAKLRLAPADPAASERGEGRLRPLEVADCTMCGVTRPLGLLVSDGGTACADVRWYCKDVRSCTERWTTALPQQPEGLPQETQPATPLRRPHAFLTGSAVAMAVAGAAFALLPALRAGPRDTVGGSNGTGRGYHAPFGQKGFYFSSGGPSESALPPVPAEAALKNR
jgi:hypothetical protein